MDRANRNKLRTLLNEHFNMREIDELCFDLDIDSELLSEKDKGAKIIDFITYCERRDLTVTLLEICHQTRPDVDWPDLHSRDSALFKRFWQISNQEKLVCAISTAGKKEIGPYIRRMTGFGEIKGYASIIYSLSQAYETSLPEETHLYFGDTFRAHEWREGSMIVVGGDDVNKVAHDVLKRFSYTKRPLPFEFITQANGQKWLSLETPLGTRIFKPTYKNDQTEVEFDYGIVARLPNPYAPKRKLFIFAGCHTYGTAAAAKVTAVKSILRILEKTYPAYDYQQNKYFLLVVRAAVLGQNTMHIDTLESFCPLEEKSLAISDAFTNQTIRF